MKKLMTKIACAAALLLPAASFAYSGNSSSDLYDFTLGATSDISIGANWSDLVYNFFQSANGSLGWTLVGTGSNVGFAALSGSVTDGPGLLGSTTIGIAGLNAGDYELTFSGTWANGSGTRLIGGKVNLQDGDVILGPFREAQTFVSTPVAAVPEPESYAMLLAGLGLMGTIARRRSRQ